MSSKYCCSLLNKFLCIVGIEQLWAHNWSQKVVHRMCTARLALLKITMQFDHQLFENEAKKKLNKIKETYMIHYNGHPLCYFPVGGRHRRVYVTVPLLVITSIFSSDIDSSDKQEIMLCIISFNELEKEDACLI